MNQKRRTTTRKNVSNKKRKTHSKRRRRNYTRLYILIFILIVILGILITLIAKRNAISLWRKGYDKEERKILLSLDKRELKEYLKLDEALDLDTWIEYTSDYHMYDYILYQEKNTDVSNDDVIQYVDALYDNRDSLEELGYTMDFFRSHYVDYSSEDVSTIYKENISYETAKKYFDINGCQISDLKEYIDSGSKPLKAVLSISYPFINSEYQPEKDYKISNPKKYDVLIKNGFFLDEDYEPSDLVEIDLPLSEDIESASLRKDAASALMEMAKDAKKEDLYIGIRSSYRSYSDQEAVYDYYMTMYGYAYASQLVSPPGSSEHQLGLGVDLTSQSVIDGTYSAFDQSPEYDWVIENCHKYGFILRYPEDKTDMTGAMNEPWHFRYVGKKAATEIHENNWTLEEYIMKHGFSYQLILK